MATPCDSRPGPTGIAGGSLNQKALQEDILVWFAANRRDLPWRRENSPYAVWISEIMLQQTQVKRVIDRFVAWMRCFPAIPMLAAASEDDVLKAWEGLGYYSRARNIHRTARVLVRDFGGEFPEDYQKIRTFPGIGRYTAGAILSLAFGRDYPAVDGNIRRLFARLYDIDTPISEEAAQKEIWQRARDLIPEGRARDFNQALMELGALVCLPRRAGCQRCPVLSHCRSHGLGVVQQRPVQGRRRATVVVESVTGILLDGGLVLIRRRPAGALWGDLWEFPGARIASGEDPEEALAREFRDSLGIEIATRGWITDIRHSYTNHRATRHCFLCAMTGIAPGQAAVSRARWEDPRHLDSLPFPAPLRRLIRHMDGWGLWQGRGPSERKGLS